MIQDLNHHVSGWTDWNMVLDMRGGPNWAGNRHDAPIIIDSDNLKYYKNPMFYHMGHFSKFLSRSFSVNEFSENESKILDDVHFTVASNGEKEVMIFLNNQSKDVSVSVESQSGAILN